MKRIYCFLVALLLVGCATAKIERLSQLPTSTPVVKSSERVFVSLPQDGKWGKERYNQSGEDVQQAFSDALSAYTDYVSLGKQVLSLEEAKNEAKKQRATVLIYPTIIHWEDRNTHWSNKRDKVRINVAVYSLDEDTILDRSSLYTTNSSFSGSFSNTPPSVLLPKVVAPYVKALYE